eukprot:UN06285
MTQCLSQAISIVIFLNSNYLCTTHAQTSSQETDHDKMPNNVANKVNLWLNGIVLFFLVLLFIYSIRFTPKCRRRRRRLPHEIRLEKTKKEINQQLKCTTDNIKNANDKQDEYINNESSDNEYENTCDIAIELIEESKQDNNDINEDSYGHLLINNINHYMQSQYDGYKESHTHFVKDMLGMNAYNDCIENDFYDSEYEPL